MCRSGKTTAVEIPQAETAPLRHFQVGGRSSDVDPRCNVESPEACSGKLQSIMISDADRRPQLLIVVKIMNTDEGGTPHGTLCL